MKNMKWLVVLFVFCFITSVVVSCKKQSSVTPPPVVTQGETTKPKEMVDPKTPSNKQEVVVSKPADIVPNYEIIKRSNQERKDAGLTLYVVIRPVDLSNNAFMGQIKNLVKKIVKEEDKQGNLTLEIFDSMNALDWMVSKKSSTAPLLQVNHIAKYVGNSKEDPYPTTLYFFPSAQKDNPSVKSYIETIDFNPSL